MFAPWADGPDSWRAGSLDGSGGGGSPWTCFGRSRRPLTPSRPGRRRSGSLPPCGMRSISPDRSLVRSRWVRNTAGARPGSTSPTHQSSSPADLEGRVLVQRTSAGTQGVIVATCAERLFAASLVCASATVAAIDSTGLGAPTYVITGRCEDTLDDGEEDLLAAKLIERARGGRSLEATAIARAVTGTPSAVRILAMSRDHAHPDDVAYATAVDRFDFAMEVGRTDSGHRMVAEIWLSRRAPGAALARADQRRPSRTDQRLGPVVGTSVGSPASAWR